MVQSGPVNRLLLLLLLWSLAVDGTTAFVVPASRQQQQQVVTRQTIQGGLFLQPHNDNDNDNTSGDPQQAHATRRSLLLGTAATAAATAASLFIRLPAGAASSTDSNSVYKAAKRPTAYRVDSTVPPTLLSVASAREQTQVLKQLAQGSGTDKQAIIVDTVNLNNILNKAVFGSAAYVQAQFLDKDESKSGKGYASYLCLGVPKLTSPDDIALVAGLLSSVAASTKPNTPLAVGLHWAPLSTQKALEEYAQSHDYTALTAAMTEAGVPAATVELYQPLLELLPGVAADMLALSPEYADLETALKQGLQQVNPERRATYVLDSQGFIGMTQDPQFKMYTDRSLFKDLPKTEQGSSAKSKVKEGDFFAQRILAHETAASVAAQYAQKHQAATDAAPTPLVALVAPQADLRFLVGGMNGRLARVSNHVGLQKVNPNAVTTILCNPTAQETLSKTRYLRLEIGTGPETLDFQSKVADYLWFSQSPKVNLIPRLMN